MLVFYHINYHEILVMVNLFVHYTSEQFLLQTSDALVRNSLDTVVMYSTHV